MVNAKDIAMLHEAAEDTGVVVTPEKNILAFAKRLAEKHEGPDASCDGLRFNGTPVIQPVTDEGKRRFANSAPSTEYREPVNEHWRDMIA